MLIIRRKYEIRGGSKFTGEDRRGVMYHLRRKDKVVRGGQY